MAGSIETFDRFGRIMNDGLENFLWKLSLPETPSYNVNTDVEFSVRLWFHNGIGKIISCPFLDLSRFKRNWEFDAHAHYAISAVGKKENRAVDGEGVNLGEFCFDLTPFVQSIEMPSIGTSEKTNVETLFGNMQTGAFSPYSSDGGQTVTMHVIDTQYSILDAIFYPWLRMIGTPRWYDAAYAEEQRTTPYPYCTLEISTPMRFYKEPGGEGGASTKTNYSFEFIGARPSQYGAPEINAQGRSQLLRNLTMVCDLVIVDLDKDSTVHPEAKPPENEYKSFGVEGITGERPKVRADPVQPAPDPPADGDNSTDTEKQIKDAEDEKEKKEDERDETEEETDAQEQNQPPGGPTDELPPEDEDDPPPEPEDDAPPENEDDPPPTVDGVTDVIDGIGNLVNQAVDIANQTSDITGMTAGLTERSASVTRDDKKLVGDEIVESIPIEDALKTLDSKNTPGKVASPITWAVNKLSNNIVFNTTSSIVKADSSKRDSVGDLITDSISEEISGQAYINPDVQSMRSVLNAVSKSDLLTDPREQIGNTTLASMVNDIANSTRNSKAYPTWLAQGKSAGVVVDRAGNAKAVDSYGKVVSTKDALFRIYSHLIRRYKSNAEKYMALQTLYMSKFAPSNSIPFTYTGKWGLWLTGFYLTPVHNALLVALGINETSIERETNPFIFRFAYMTTNQDPVLKKAVIMNVMEGHDKEYMQERVIGSSMMIRECSMWEIIDSDNNYTGTYWCKLWLTNKGDSITRGRIAICKLNHLGNVITDSSINDMIEAAGMFDISDNGIYLSKEKFNFTKVTSDTIYSSPDSDGNEWKIKLSGAYELDFHPLNAIRPCDKFAKTWQVASIDPDDVETKSDLWHIDQFPDEFFKEDGSWNFTPAGGPGIEIGHLIYFLDKVKDGELYYNIINLDEESTPADPARHFIAKPMGEYEAISLYESLGKQTFRKTATLDLASDIRKVNDRDVILYIRLKDTFKGRGIDLPKFYTVTRSTSDIDVFQSYIPKTLKYVIQYNQHSCRLKAMKIEYDKLYRMLVQMRAKRDEIESRLPEIRERLVEIHDDVRPILIHGAKLTALSEGYNELTNAEITEEDNLETIREKHDRVTKSYSETDYTELDKYISRAEQTHLSQMSVARTEKALADIRKKLREIIVEYNNTKEALTQEVIDNKDLFQEYLDLCYEYEWKKDFARSMVNGIKNFTEFLAWKRDRRNKVEKMTTLFEHQMTAMGKYTPEELATVDVDDLILFYDWMASLVSISELDRSEANTLAYRLRKEVKIPTLNQEISSLDKKLNRLYSELEQHDQLVYDIDYEGTSKSEEDEEQEPLKVNSTMEVDESVSELSHRFATGGEIKHGMPRSRAKKMEVDESVAILNKRFSEGSQRPKVEEKPTLNKKDLDRILEAYKHTHPSFANYNKEELRTSLLLVLSSRYLNETDPEFYQKLTSARANTSKLITINENYKQTADKEIELLQEATNSGKNIEKEITSIEKKIDKTLSKAGGPTRDERQDIRFAIMRKAELQEKLVKIRETISEISDHYNKVTRKTMNGYERELKQSRKDYDNMLSELEYKINFEEKLIGIAKHLN